MEYTPKRNSRKEQYWRYHVDSWRESGRSQKAYCSSHGLALATFGYWKRKIDQPVCDKPSFYPLTLKSNQTGCSEPKADSGKLILHIRNYKLEIREGFASDHLIKVINALEQLP